MRIVKVAFIVVPLILALAAPLAHQHALKEAQSARLEELGSGVCVDLQAKDFPLVERALAAGNTKDRELGCSAVVILCYTQSYKETVPEFASASRLAEKHLNQEYVDRIFPRLLDVAKARGSDPAEIGVRAIGALASYTKLLTADQIAKSCDHAVISLHSGDFEDRRRGVDLLADLMGRLDVKNAREKHAIDELLDIVEAWQRSNRLEWHQWQRELSERDSAKKRFQAQALKAVLHNCKFVTDKDQVMRAYQFLKKGLANRTLDLQALVSTAQLASRLPAAERHNVV
jgi:hypothetical protein